MISIKPHPTQKEILDYFIVDVDKGLLWKKRYNRKGDMYISDEPSGGESKEGYRRVRVKGVIFKTHRLIWIAANGPIPAGMLIDHEKGKEEGDGIANLRMLTQSENMWGHRNTLASTSKYNGVHYCKKTDKWVASIRLYGRLKSLGGFQNEDSAARVRDRALRKFSGADGTFNFPQADRAARGVKRKRRRRKKVL